MASERRALQQLTAAAPVPRYGRDLVEYAGGRQAAVRALSGMDGPPGRRSNYASDAAYADARRTWRNASRQVQRATAGEGHQQRGQVKGVQLTPGERRRLQGANRERRRAAVRRQGIRATLTALIVIASPGKGGRDSRRRTITNGGAGILIGDGAEILDALRDGDDDAAAELLVQGFLDAAGMPEYTEISGASWTLAPADE